MPLLYYYYYYYYLINARSCLTRYDIIIFSVTVLFPSVAVLHHDVDDFASRFLLGDCFVLNWLS